MNEERVQQGLIERWICGVLDWLIERARDGYDQKRRSRMVPSGAVRPD